MAVTVEVVVVVHEMVRVQVLGADGGHGDHDLKKMVPW